MTISLGFDPLPLEVRLAEDSDFVAALVAPDPWPPGTTIRLSFPLKASTVEWTAEIEGEWARWRIPAEEVAELIAARPGKVRLGYRDPDTGQLRWAQGTVDVQ